MADAQAAVAVPTDGERADGVVVRAARLTKRFGKFTAVEDVRLTMRGGEIVAMIGPNGAGKSTVINMISGELLPTEGEIHVHGVRVHGRHAHEIASLGLARTFQTPRLFEGMSALETIMVARDQFSRSGVLAAALHLPRMRRDETVSRESAMAWLDYVGLAGTALEPATALPVGSQRLVEVARALAHEPDVLLLDEPAAGLDHTETGRLGELVRTIAKHGVAILFVEHDMRLVMSIADRVIVLDQGKLIAEGTPIEVGQDPRVVEAYLGTAAKA